jgi:hypothetical protein
MTDTSLPTPRFAEGDFRAGRVFSRTFSVLSRNLLPFCIVTTIAGLPYFLLLAAGAGAVRIVAVSRGAVAGIIIVGVVLSWVLNALSQAVVLYGAFEDMRGRPVNLIESTKIGLGRILPVTGVALGTAIVFMLFLIPGPIILGRFGFLLLIPGLITLIALFVAIPACVVERIGPSKSMGRSLQLTKGHRWKVFGLWIATIVGGLIVQAVLLGLTGLVGGHVLQSLL